MATRRKTFTRTKQAHKDLPADERIEHACFIADALDGTITASRLVEIRDGQNRLVRLDYDDPNGDALASGRAPTK